MTPILTRALDGIEPEIIEEIMQTVSPIAGVQDISEIRARWIGHKLRVELNIAVEPTLTVTQGHEIAKEVQHALHHHMDYLSLAMVHVDPLHQSGERHHPHA